MPKKPWEIVLSGGIAHWDVTSKVNHISNVFTVKSSVGEKLLSVGGVEWDNIPPSWRSTPSRSFPNEQYTIYCPNAKNHHDFTIRIIAP